MVTHMAIWISEHLASAQAINRCRGFLACIHLVDAFLPCPNNRFGPLVACVDHWPSASLQPDICERDRGQSDHGKGQPRSMAERRRMAQSHGDVSVGHAVARLNSKCDYKGTLILRLGCNGEELKCDPAELANRGRHVGSAASTRLRFALPRLFPQQTFTCT